MEVVAADLRAVCLAMLAAKREKAAGKSVDQVRGALTSRGRTVRHCCLNWQRACSPSRGCAAPVGLVLEP
jgi:hypothetical protein